MGQDTRKDPRAKVLSLNVRYKSATVDEFIEHHSHDISKGGIFIKTPSPFPAGTLLKFEIRIREDQPLIAGVGRVVWKREPPQAGADRPAGMGVKFIKLDGHSRELIDRIVAERKTEGPSFEETPDGLSPSMRPPPSAPAPASAPPVNTVSAPGGGSFFPSGPPAELPPPAERTVIKQADEILADALKGAGLGDVSAPAPPIEMPKSSPAPATGGTPPRKATLLGMPAAPGAAFKLPDEVAAAAREYDAKTSKPESTPPPHEPAPALKSEPPTAKEPATRTVSDRPAPAVEEKKPISERPAAAAAAIKSEPPPARAESRRPPPLAAAAAPVKEPQKGGAAGWLVVLLLVGAAGAGGYYLMTKSSDTPQPAPTTAPAPSPSVTAEPAPSPSVTAEPAPSPSPAVTETAPVPSVSAPPSVSAAPSVSAPATAKTTAAPPPTTAAPPPPPPPATTTAAPKPPPPPPATTTAAPKPPPPKPPPKPPADDNPYQ